jgi:hypothetical protein
MFVLGRGATDFRQTILGTRAGADSYTLLEGGTVERVDTHISKGVTDELGLEPSANTISFATSARHAPLTLTLSGASGAALHTATISTTSSRGGGDFLGFTRSRTGLSFVHRGAAATFTVTLSTLEHNGSPSTFSSGPLHIAPGQTAQIGGVRWDALLGSRLRVRIGGRTLTVVNRLRSPRLARIARLSVATARRGAVALTIRASIARLPRGGVVALAWIVRRGGRVTRVHTATVTVAHGTLSRTWTFRAPARGRYRLTARVMVLVPTGPAGVSSSAVTATAGFRH